MTSKLILDDESLLWKKQRILTLNGIIAQLSKTRLNRTISKLDLPFAQFVLLQHFSHNPEKSWTITKLTEAMESNQPAMTKTVQRLCKKKFLLLKQDAKDKRKKYIFITASGMETILKVFKEISPELMTIFKSWTEQQLDQLLELQETLKNQLDENRNPMI